MREDEGRRKYTGETTGRGERGSENENQNNQEELAEGAG